MKTFSYFIGLIVFGFISNITWCQIALQNGSGNPLLNTFSCFGFILCVCGLIYETYQNLTIKANKNK